MSRPALAALCALTALLAGCSGTPSAKNSINEVSEGCWEWNHAYGGAPGSAPGAGRGAYVGCDEEGSGSGTLSASVECLASDSGGGYGSFHDLTSGSVDLSLRGPEGPIFAKTIRSTDADAEKFLFGEITAPGKYSLQAVRSSDSAGSFMLYVGCGTEN